MDMAEPESNEMMLYGHVTEQDVLEVFDEWHEEHIHCECFDDNGKHECPRPKVKRIRHGWGRWVPDWTGDYYMQFWPCQKSRGAFAYSAVDLEDSQ